MRTPTLLLTLLLLPPPANAAEIAPTGTLRAVYIRSNIAQAVHDPATNTYSGVSAAIARELARRHDVPLTITPRTLAEDVVEAVRSGAADIGFVAPNPDRMIVLYSQTYMLVQQSFLVKDGSPIRSVKDLDRPGQTIGSNAGDSLSLYLTTHFTHATLKTSPDYTMHEPAAWLADGTVIAFGGNRQRLGISTRNMPGLHLLPDNLYAVPQAIAVSRPETAQTIDSDLNDMRASGFLHRAVQESGVDGIDVAPTATSTPAPR